MSNIANFRHKYKGKALAGSLPLAELRSLDLAGYAPRHSPDKWTTGLARAQRQSRFATR
jgi:hypothetical protein